MSGGSHNYEFYRLEEEYCGKMHDRELDAMMADLVKLLHDLEWYDSGDIGEESYRESVSSFKRKWLGGSVNERISAIIDEATTQLRDELKEMMRPYDNERRNKHGD